MPDSGQIVLVNLKILQQRLFDGLGPFARQSQISLAAANSVRMPLDQEYLVWIIGNDPFDNGANPVQFGHFFDAQESLTKAKSDGVNINARH